MNWELKLIKDTMMVGSINVLMQRDLYVLPDKDLVMKKWSRFIYMV